MDFKDMKFALANDVGRGVAHDGVGRSNLQYNVFDYLSDIPGNAAETDIVEVQFKNTRKGYYLNASHLYLKKGQTVAVEASPGHDIGVITLIGRLAAIQMRRSCLRSVDELKVIYRVARDSDLEKYNEAKSREHATMIRSREIAKELKLDMKIGDVEYQGDGNKAIFYYIADGRVDFRQLIRVLAEAFHVRVEMKQIGARQEAGRIGGTGPCGRELCCSTWMKNFSSVSTNVARYQDISPNPQKLAGMCAKLKCCLLYEVDDYMEAGKSLPDKSVTLETADAEYHYVKADILAGTVMYSTDKRSLINAETISAARAAEIIAMNKEGKKPQSLKYDERKQEKKRPKDLLAGTDISRFDKAKKRKKANKNKPAAAKNARPDTDKQRSE
ncbi:MAG: hypothetical protein LUC22_02855 [Prevotella sp.]|nr:hypothetical protein [Prevotella sp.]